MKILARKSFSALKYGQRDAAYLYMEKFSSSCRMDRDLVLFMYFLLLLFADWFCWRHNVLHCDGWHAASYLTFPTRHRIPTLVSPKHHSHRSNESTDGRWLTLHLDDKYCHFHLAQRCYDSILWRIHSSFVGCSGHLSSRHKSCT